ncbi:hypothetical protein [Winogradskyella forsetii]|uniref:hypothetical protein n=1 Tax=Winogradskyella forsetii TaxID=2686077 RepID=UPI0015BAA181|nr:hypothetical protein [Winogradskyella forsetii]
MTAQILAFIVIIVVFTAQNIKVLMFNELIPSLETVYIFNEAIDFKKLSALDLWGSRLSLVDW